MKRRTLIRAGIGLAGIAVLVSSVMSRPQNSTPVVIGICGGITLDGWCVEHPTQAQLDRYNSQQKEREERQRREAEERQAREEEHRRQVDEQLARMGGNPARRAEAERFVQMQEAAAAARDRLNAARNGGRTPSGAIIVSQGDAAERARLAAEERRRQQEAAAYEAKKAAERAEMQRQALAAQKAIEEDKRDRAANPCKYYGLVDPKCPKKPPQPSKPARVTPQ